MEFWQIIIVLCFVVLVWTIIGLRKPMKEKLTVQRGNWTQYREESIACEKVNSPISDKSYNDFMDQGISCVENDKPDIRFMDGVEDVKHG